MNRRKEEQLRKDEEERQRQQEKRNKEKKMEEMGVSKSSRGILVCGVNGCDEPPNPIAQTTV